MGGRRRGTGAPLIAGTSSEFLGRKPLPRAVRERPLVVLAGPPGSGKATVALRFVGEEPVVRLSAAEAEAAALEAVRRKGWSEALQGAPALVVVAPPGVERPGLARALAALVRARVEAGRRTVLLAPEAARWLGPPFEGIDPVLRATVLLRFPVGRGRRRFEQRACAELGLPAAALRSYTPPEPWTYAAVRAALGALTGAGGAPPAPR
jgi:hypothetical protein